MFLNGPDNTRKLLVPLIGASAPYLIHSSLCQPESSSQTASQSVQPFLYGPQILCCTMHYQWGRKPPKLPNLGFRHPAGGGPSHGNNMQKIIKMRACSSEHILTNRQTHTHTNTHTYTPMCSLPYFATGPAGEVTNGLEMKIGQPWCADSLTL